MRESGYYWIKISIQKIDDPADTEEGWEVGFYLKGEGWYSMWDGGEYQDKDLIEIDENKLKH